MKRGELRLFADNTAAVVDSFGDSRDWCYVTWVQGPAAGNRATMSKQLFETGEPAVVRTLTPGVKPAAKTVLVKDYRTKAGALPREGFLERRRPSESDVARAATRKQRTK